MNSKINTFLLITIIVLSATILYLVINIDYPPKEIDIIEETQGVEEVGSSDEVISVVLNALPREIKVGEREALIDRVSLPLSNWSEYSLPDDSHMPYILNGNGYTKGDSPLSFVERYIRLMYATHELPEFIRYKASLHSLEEGGGVAVIIRAGKMPGNPSGYSVEERFDFVLENKSWKINKHGSREYCPIGSEEGRWQPSGQTNCF